MGKAVRSNKPRKGARKGWEGDVKRPNTDKQKPDPNPIIKYNDLILLVPFRSLGLFALLNWWPFGETTIIDYMGEASDLSWQARLALLSWGCLELYAIWPFKGESKAVLPLTYEDEVERNIKDKMAEQKRKIEQMLEGKDAIIEEGQKKLKTVERQMIAFQENLNQKDNEISELKKENNKLVSELNENNNKLVSELNETKQNLRDTNKKLDDVRDKKIDAEAKLKQRDEQIHHLQMKQTELASTLKLTKNERLNFCNDLQTARKQLHDTEKKLFEVREQKMEAEAEKHDTLKRSGEMVSDIFFDKNPDIVHLSDENRPTKLAEMFSELYDNEWTAAYTVMEDEHFQERHIIDFLLDVVMESYVFFKIEVDNSWNVVSKWFLDDGLPKVQQTRKALKDGRKAIALKLLPEIEEKYTSYLEGICRHEPLKKLLSIEDIRKYMALCVKLTLPMNANDPPVHLECSGWKPIRDRLEEQEDILECKKKNIYVNNFKELPEATRAEFEKDKYKEYTTRGRYTIFYVWPILYLHKGGPMLGKGIAQGAKDSKAEPSDKPWAWWK